MEDQDPKEEDLLIELALDESRQDDEDPYELEVKRFIHNYNIKGGEAGIPLYLIYDFYYWRTDYPLTKAKFNAVFSKWFRKHLSLNYTYFKLDPEPLGLPGHYTLRAELRRHLRKSRNAKKNKAKKSKSSKK